MKKNMLTRYERDERGNVIIDVSAFRTEDLYSNFDRNAPYIRRDLDQHLVDYLLECAGEIGREAFLIRFSLEQKPTGEQIARIRRSVPGYFEYLAESERHRVRRMMRTSAVLMAMGLALFTFAVWLGGFFGEDRSVLETVIAEGMTVAAWVALWEALAKFVIEWPSHRDRLRIFRALAGCELTFAPASFGSEAELRG
jgi:hypothetical protein